MPPGAIPPNMGSAGGPPIIPTTMNMPSPEMIMGQMQYMNPAQAQ